jgi:hypothetical protein
MPPFPDNFTTNSKLRFENSVMSVVFGLNTPVSLIDEIRNTVSAVKPKISYKRVVRDPLTFNRELAELP